MPSQRTPWKSEQKIHLSLFFDVQRAANFNRRVLLHADMKTRLAAMGNGFKELGEEVGGTTGRVKAGSRWQKAVRTREGFLSPKITEILEHRIPIVKASPLASSHQMAKTIPSSPATAIKKVLQIFPNIPYPGESNCPQ